MTGITGALNFIDLPGASTPPASLPTLSLPACFSTVHFCYPTSPRGKVPPSGMGRQTRLILPWQFFAIGGGKEDRSEKFILARHYPGHPNAPNHVPGKRKTNPKLPVRVKGSSILDCPGAASVRGFTSRNGVVRASGCVIWRAARAVFGPVHTHLFRPCLCNRLTLNQSVRERTVFL
jgi:hypothetical protein